MPFCFMVEHFVSTKLLIQLSLIHFIFIAQGKKEQTNQQNPSISTPYKTSLTAEQISVG